MHFWLCWVYRHHLSLPFMPASAFSCPWDLFHAIWPLSCTSTWINWSWPLSHSSFVYLLQRLPHFERRVQTQNYWSLPTSTFLWDSSSCQKNAFDSLHSYRLIFFSATRDALLEDRFAPLRGDTSLQEIAPGVFSTVQHQASSHEMDGYRRQR